MEEITRSILTMETIYAWFTTMRRLVESVWAVPQLLIESLQFSIHFLNCLYNLGAQGAAAYSSCPRVKGGIYLSTSRVRQTTTHSHIHTYCRMATDMHANQTSMSLYCGWEPERVQTVAGRTCRLYTERSPMDADVDISSIKLEY